MLINKKHVREAVKKCGKRWSKGAEETLNSAVLGIILKSALLCRGFKTIRRAEVLHALQNIGKGDA